MAGYNWVPLTVLGAVALAAVAWVAWIPPMPPSLSAGTLLPEPKPIAPFELVDTQRRPFDQQNLQGRWHLLFLGFTHCPDVCPTTLSLLTAVDRQVHAKGGDFGTVFLSADPERDTPPVMAQYLAHFNPAFIGLTGDKKQVDALCSSLGLAYVKNPGVGGEYTVDHSAALVLIDPQARVVAYFQPPHDADRLAADIVAVIR